MIDLPQSFSPNWRHGAMNVIICILAILVCHAMLQPNNSRYIAAPWAALALYNAIRAWHSFTTSIDVDEMGVTLRRFQTCRTMYWQDVAVFLYHAITPHNRNRQSLPLGVQYHYELLAENGDKLTLGSNVASAKQLGEVLIERTTHELLPKLRHRLRNGEKLDFGQMRLSLADGLEFNHGLKAWEKVEPSAVVELSTDLDDNSFYLRVAGENKSREGWLSHAPNYFVLYELIDEIRSGAFDKAIR